MTKLEEYLSPAFKNIILEDARFAIVQAVRRSGKTRYICFKAIIESIHSISNIYIGVIHHQMIGYLKNQLLDLYRNIPDGIKPKITGVYGNRIQFENGSQIIIETVSNNGNSLCGLTINCLLLDEFAYVKNEIADEFLNNVMGCLAGSKDCRVHIVSTRNSRSKKNSFWEIWLNSVKDNNIYRSYKITTKDCPWINTKQFKFHMSRSVYEREFTIRNK